MPDSALPTSIGVEIEFKIGRADAAFTDENRRFRSVIGAIGFGYERARWCRAARASGLPVSTWAFPRVPAMPAEFADWNVPTNLALSGEGWNAGTDGTVDCEFRSPIFRQSTEMLRQIPIACDLIKSELAGFTDRRAGLHIHLGMPDDRVRQEFCLLLHELMPDLLAITHRDRHSNSYCAIPRFTTHGMDPGNADTGGLPNMRNAINPKSHYLTTEVRLQAGSVNSKFILGWINTLLHLFSRAKALAAANPRMLTAAQCAARRYSHMWFYEAALRPTPRQLVARHICRRNLPYYTEALEHVRLALNARDTYAYSPHEYSGLIQTGPGAAIPASAGSVAPVVVPSQSQSVAA